MRFYDSEKSSTHTVVLLTLLCIYLEPDPADVLGGSYVVDFAPRKAKHFLCPSSVVGSAVYIIMLDFPIPPSLSSRPGASSCYMDVVGPFLEHLGSLASWKVAAAAGRLDVVLPGRVEIVEVPLSEAEAAAAQVDRPVLSSFSFLVGLPVDGGLLCRRRRLLCARGGQRRGAIVKLFN